MITNSLNDNSKCFSGVLRRMVCTGSLPTHPSDLIITEPIKPTYFDHPEKDKKNAVAARTPAPTPGVVARLMGLDSFPDFKYWSPKQRTDLNSVPRSRSANSVDHLLPEFSPTRSRHRRVRTSGSVPEIPTGFYPSKNYDFFVLCCERIGGINKSEMGLEELKKEEEKERKSKNLRERKLVKKENEDDEKDRERKKVPNRVQVKCQNNEVNLPRKNKVVHSRPKGTLKGKSAVKHHRINDKETSVESKFRRKKTSRLTAKKVQPVRNSEILNIPVSVLDRRNIWSHHEITLSGDSRVTVSKSRTKPYSNSAPNFVADDNLLGAKRSRDEKQIKKSDKETIQYYYYSELLREVLRLTEEETEESDWRIAQKAIFINFEDVEEICAVFGRQILELLFHQIVDELVTNMID